MLVSIAVSGLFHSSEFWVRPSTSQAVRVEAESTVTLEGSRVAKFYLGRTGPVRVMSDFQLSIPGKIERRFRGVDFFDTTDCQFLRAIPATGTPELEAAEETRGLILTYRGRHRLGMCQSGAAGMAVDGASFRTILNHYYPATTLTRLPFSTPASARRNKSIRFPSTQNPPTALATGGSTIYKDRSPRQPAAARRGSTAAPSGE